VTQHTGEDVASYSLNGLSPQSVIFPASAEDAAAELARAAAGGLMVTPWGGGTHQRLGGPPKGNFTVISTAKLNKFLEHSPADLTATVEAGMTLENLQHVLAQHGQMVALDAPLSHRATIGGILAAADIGPRRLGYGQARDQVIGIKVAHSDGRVTKAGGKVVKNVSGYDMMKLYVGSLGTLGVIVEVTFRLYPLPATTRTVLAPCRSFEDAMSLCHVVRGARLQPLALDTLSQRTQQGVKDAQAAGPSPWLVATEFGGGDALVTRQAREVGRLAEGLNTTISTGEGQTSGSFWQQVRDFGREPEHPWLALRAAVLPGRLPLAETALRQHITETGVPSPALIARAGSGLLYAFWSPPDVATCAPEAWLNTVQQFRKECVGLGGSLVIESCPDSLWGVLDPWGEAPVTLPVMRRLKELFDPRGILNPGRYVGGL